MSVTVPGSMAGSFGAFSARFRISLTSALSMPPVFVKNLKPLRLNGWWLAVISTAASQSKFTVVMNMAGVEDRPQFLTCTPASVSPLMIASVRRSAEMRESCPTATVNVAPYEGVSLSSSQQAKP